jgi:hypothetical protein
MKPANLLRSSYTLILRMHPQAFRDRFADEMLWIFDQEHKRGAAPRLIFDGIASLIRQRSNTATDPAPTLAGFGLLDTSCAIAPRRFVEATLTASLILACVLLLLGKSGKPLLLPCLPGSPPPTPYILQAPSRILALPRTQPTPHTRVDPAQVNNSAASAVRIANAPSHSSGPGYCSQD